MGDQLGLVALAAQGGFKMQGALCRVEGALSGVQGVWCGVQGAECTVGMVVNITFKSLDSLCLGDQSKICL